MFEPIELVVNNIPIELVHKHIKNFHLRIYPPQGRVCISAPMRATRQAVLDLIQKKMNWILGHRAKILTSALFSPVFADDAKHPFLGALYPLRLTHNARQNSVLLKNDTLEIHLTAASTQEECAQTLDTWYRSQLQKKIVPLCSQWQTTMQLHVNDWRIKKMKTRWGTCNIRAKRIWLNLELIKYPLPCIEYVITHELAHLLERHHNNRFAAIMTHYLPNWKKHKRTLLQNTATFPAP